MSVFREINMILSSTLNNPPPSELMIKLFCPVIKLGKDQGQSGYRDMGVTDQVYRCCDDSLIAIQQQMVSQFGTLPHYLPSSATDTDRKQNNSNYKGNCKSIGHMDIIGVDHIVAWSIL